MSVAENSTEMVVRTKREIVVSRIPRQPGENSLMRAIAQRMVERGVACFLRVDEQGVSLIAA